MCEIKKGARQGCPLFPRLFNVRAEEITKHRVFQRLGFKIGGERISDVCYADDHVLIAGTPNQLQIMMNV